MDLNPIASKKKHKSGNKQHNQQLLPAQVPIAIPAQVPITMPTLFPQPSANANPTLQNPLVSMPSGFTNQGSNVQYIAIPAGHIPPFTFSEFSRGGGDFHRGSNNGRNSRGRGRRGRGNFARSQGENDAYSMDVASFNIFENQIIPVGLHNLSKSFRPNLTTTRVFALGTKFIPVWKMMDIKKPLLNSRILEGECQTKYILLRLHLVRLLETKIFTSKIIGGLTNSTVKLTAFVLEYAIVFQI